MPAKNCFIHFAINGDFLEVTCLKLQNLTCLRVPLYPGSDVASIEVEIRNSVFLHLLVHAYHVVL